MSVMRTLLVVSYDGENPDEIANLYSEDTKVEPYVYLYRKDIKSRQNAWKVNIIMIEFKSYGSGKKYIKKEKNLWKLQ